MTVAYAYGGKNNEIFLSQIYQRKRELAPLYALNNLLSINPELISRPYMCEASLVSTLHRGTEQYTGMLTKHDTPIWLASRSFGGTIDFYYSQFEWPFQIRFHPKGFLGDFVIDRLENGFIVPLFTRQIRKDDAYLSKAHDSYAWESRRQVKERAISKLVLTAR